MLSSLKKIKKKLELKNSKKKNWEGPEITPEEITPEFYYSLFEK